MDRSGGSSSYETAVRTTAFGLDVESDVALSLLDGAVARPTGRRLSLSVGAGAAGEWPESAQLLCDDHQPDGTLVYRIEAHAEAGYLIRGPDFGAHVLSADGRLVDCDPEGLPAAGWQRLLIAQVLPFAALLQGLEVFHASAVVHRGRAVAFLGPSGSGKTSLALALCGAGARFLADDVLALECREGRLLAHPGTPVAGVARMREQTRSEADHAVNADVVAVNAREQLVRIAGATDPVEVGAMFFLDRRGQADGDRPPRFEPVSDAQMLLAATFNFVLATPGRLRGLLEVCALAARTRVERIVCGPETSLDELGAGIELRLGASP